MTEFISPQQCKAARALLGWTQPELAQKAGMSLTTLADFERGARRPFPNNARAIRAALEEVGLIFERGGVVFAFDMQPAPVLHATVRVGIPRKKTLGDILDEPIGQEEESDELGSDQG